MDEYRQVQEILNEWQVLWREMASENEKAHSEIKLAIAEMKNHTHKRVEQCNVCEVDVVRQHQRIQEIDKRITLRDKIGVAAILALIVKLGYGLFGIAK